jgi:hypothetical protein
MTTRYLAKTKYGVAAGAQLGHCCLIKQRLMSKACKHTCIIGIFNPIKTQPVLPENNEVGAANKAPRHTVWKERNNSPYNR